MFFLFDLENTVWHVSPETAWATMLLGMLEP